MCRVVWMSALWDISHVAVRATSLRRQRRQPGVRSTTRLIPRRIRSVKRNDTAFEGPCLQCHQLQLCLFELELLLKILILKDPSQALILACVLLFYGRLGEVGVLRWALWVAHVPFRPVAPVECCLLPLGLRDPRTVPNPGIAQPPKIPSIRAILGLQKPCGGGQLRSCNPGIAGVPGAGCAILGL